MSEAASEPVAQAHGARPLVRYAVWDARTRWLHWTTAALVLLSASIGLLFTWRGELQIISKEAKIALKEFHSYVGYAVLACLLLRLWLGFAGNRYARWAAVLPTRKSLGEAGPEARALWTRAAISHHLGHGPLGRLSSSALIATLLVVVGSGLVRAGTDVYLPPFGGTIAAYVAADGVDPAELHGLSDKSQLDPGRADRINKLKQVFGPLHEYGSWLLMLLIALHVIGLVLKEQRQGGAVFSSMVTGDKLYPADEPVQDD